MTDQQVLGAVLAAIVAAPVLGTIILHWLLDPGSFGAPVRKRVVQTRPRCFWVERRSRTGWRRYLTLRFDTEREALEALALVGAPRIVAEG